MNRRDFQQLAELRIREAKVLLDTENYEGAYYLAGYAIECALKACISKQTNRYDFPPDMEKVRSIYSHKLDKLLEYAELKASYSTEQSRNPQFKAYWSVTKDWSEQSRYDTNIVPATANDLYRAITDRKNGVLRWLKKYW